MVNDTHTCPDPLCDGLMVYQKTLPAGEMVGGDATSHVDRFKCEECGAEDYE